MTANSRPAHNPNLLSHSLEVPVDTLTFITKLCEALGWPITSIALVVVLRREIRLLLPSLRKFKAGPVEAEFEKSTAVLTAELPLLPRAREATEQGIGEPVSNTSPRATVLESWLRLEATAIEALARRQEKLHGPGALTMRPSMKGLAHALLNSGLLQEDQIILLKELLHLRNEVVHTLDFSPSNEAILRYVETANYLNWWLKEAVR